MKAFLMRLIATMAGRGPRPPRSRRTEDHDLNDVGLARGAVPLALWQWRRHRVGTPW